MSKLTESLYRSPLRRREMTGRRRAAYLLLGVLAAVSLATAYWSPYQALHQTVTSLGIYGMLALGAQDDIRRRGWKAYWTAGGIQDLAVAAAWTALLVVWILDVR